MPKRTELEDELAFQMKAARLPLFEREFKAIPGRKFPWDFAFRDARLLIEVQGAIWVKGGHSTGTGITRDAEKHNLAMLNGWRDLIVTKDHIKSGQALIWIKQALGY